MLHLCRGQCYYFNSVIVTCEKVDVGLKTSLTTELAAFLLCLLQLGLQGGAVVLRLRELGLDLLQRLLQALLGLRAPRL